jgi:hypothetical protein
MMLGDRRENSGQAQETTEQTGEIPEPMADEDEFPF